MKYSLFRKRKIGFMTLLVLLSISLCILVMTFFSLTLYKQIITYVREEGTDLQRTRVLELSNCLNQSFLRLNNLCALTVMDDELIQDIRELNLYETVIYKKSVVYEDVLTRLIATKSVDRTMDSVALFTENEAIWAGQDIPIHLVLSDFSDTIIPKVTPLSPGKVLLLHFADSILQEKSSYFNAGSTFFASGVFDGMELTGLLVIKVSDVLFNEVLGDDDICAFVTDDDIIYQNDAFDIAYYTQLKAKQDTEDMLTSGGERVFIHHLPGGYGTLLLKEDMSAAIAQLSLLSYILIISIVLSILVALMVSALCVKRVTYPIQQLTMRVQMYAGQQTHLDEPPIPHSRFSLRGRLMVYLIGSVGVPMLLFIGAYFITSVHAVQNIMIDTHTTAAAQTAENVNLYIERSLLLSQDLGRNFTMQTLLASSNQKPRSGEIESLVQHYFSMWSQPEQMAILASDGSILYHTLGTTTRFIDPLFYRFQSPSKAGIAWLGLCTDDFGRNNLVITNVIKGATLSPENRSMLQDTIGYLVTFLQEDLLAQVYTPVQDIARNDVYLYGDDGIILSSLNKNAIGQPIDLYLKEACLPGDARVLVNKLRSVPLSIAMVIDTVSFQQGLFSLFKEHIFLVIILLLILMLVFGEIAFSLLKPMGRIREKLRVYLVQDTDILFTEHGIFAEVDELGRAFNDMKQRIERLMQDLVYAQDRESKLELARKSAEIRSLQSQIRPHFLCNTLESVRGLIKTGRHAEALKMLTYIGNLFRHGLSHTDTLVPLSQEITYTQAYCNIMKLRFLDRIVFTWDIDEEAQACAVPRMILQPLLENAIEHGLQPKGGHGTIQVRCFTKDGKLHIQVQDDGIGMGTQTLHQLSLPFTHGRGIGLRNVVERLHLYYDLKGRLSIESEPEHGTIITMIFPAEPIPPQ